MAKRARFGSESGVQYAGIGEWEATDRDIRAFLELTHRWAGAGYAADWEKAQRDFAQNFGRERDDPNDYVEVFGDKVAGQQMQGVDALSRR